MKKSQLILSGIFLIIIAASCATTDPGLDVMTAAQRQEEIESLDVSGSQSYWFYSLPGEDNVLIGTEKYRDELLFDVYYPGDFDFSHSLPVVVVPRSAFHEGTLLAIGKSNRMLRSSFSLGRTVAASGMAAVVYEAGNPAEDLANIVQYLNKNQKRLQLDVDRLAFWCTSSNTYHALELTSNFEARDYFTPRGLVLYYPIFHGFYDIPQDVPILLVKTSSSKYSDTHQKGFIEKAEREGIAIQIVDYAEGYPDFEYKDDTPQMRRVIEETIDFLSAMLTE